MCDIEFETVVCDLCGSDRERLLFEGPDRLHHLPGTFRLVQCVQCGWVRQNPRPTPAGIGAFYPDDYEPYIRAIDDEPSALQRWGRRYGMWKRGAAIRRYKAGGRLLDIGCATGVFLSEMRRMGGWEVCGVEPNDRAADYARDRLSLDVRTGILEDAMQVLPQASFDVVTMWNVIEHLHHPVADVERVCRLLKDDGLFVFTIPNLESLEARWFGPEWIGWDLPRHLYLFPRRALIDSLPHLGFEVRSLQCLSGSADNFALSLKLYLEARRPAGSRWPGFSLRVLRSLPARFIGGPFFWLLNRAKLSTVITVFAQKQPVGSTGR